MEYVMVIGAGFIDSEIAQGCAQWDTGFFVSRDYFNNSFSAFSASSAENYFSFFSGFTGRSRPAAALNSEPGTQSPEPRTRNPEPGTLNEDI